LYRAAEQAHKNYLTEATSGHGCDRLFLGMKLVALEYDLALHGLYQDPLFKRSCTWFMSTSQLPVEMIPSVGFGPVVDEGYGLCYQPLKSHTGFTITCWKSAHFPPDHHRRRPQDFRSQTFTVPIYTAPAALFGDHLKQAFIDLRAMLEAKSSKL